MTAPYQLTLDDALHRKRAGQARARRRCDVVDWLLLSDAIRQTALVEREFTSDEVRARTDGVITVAGHGIWGALWTEAAEKHRWIAATDRVRRSTRPEAKRHKNAIWVSLIYQPRRAA